MKLGIVIPALDEEQAIGYVVKEARRQGRRWGQVRVVVADNGSRDATAQRASEAGAEVVKVKRRGYGAACLGALQHLGPWPDLLLFLDGDGSSRPEEMGFLLQPLLEEEADLVIGCRQDRIFMSPPQRFGTRLAVILMNLRWGSSFRDVGPYRAIRRPSYEGLGMTDQTWGWTVEMQILALLKGLRVREVPVSWQARLGGKSKISGTVQGVLRAGGRILWTLLRYGTRGKAFPPAPQGTSLASPSGDSGAPLQS